MNDETGSKRPPSQRPAADDGEGARDRASDENRLRGNGVALVREREMARKVQSALSRLYSLDTTCDVADYIESADEGQRETLLVRESADGLELSLRLAPVFGFATPPRDGADEQNEREGSAARRDLHLDSVCQLIEGVSHFVYIAERANSGRSTTQLELEIQAEVDKYVVLGSSLRNLDVRTSERLRARLYDRVTYMHEADSEVGERYRVANEVAKRFTRHLEREYLAKWRIPHMRQALRSFFRMGQTDKLRAA